MKTYESMTAKELHDLVTRLEAHGFKLPEGLTYRNLPKPHSEHYKPYWAHGGTNYGYPTPFAAAIIEVAARDWYGQDVFVGRRTSAARQKDGLVFAEPAPTPLHAIVAAVEAKEGK